MILFIRHYDRDKPRKSLASNVRFRSPAPFPHFIPIREKEARRRRLPPMSGRIKKIKMRDLAKLRQLPDLGVALLVWVA